MGAIIVALTLVLVAGAVYLYRRNRGRCPTFRQMRPPERYQIDGVSLPGRLETGVWRNEPLETKAPDYTKRPSQGECSLGLGRRKSEIEEYEFRNMRSEDGRREGFTQAPILESQETTAEVPKENMVDNLPPYLPPPSPVLSRPSVERRLSGGLPTRANRYQ